MKTQTKWLSFMLGVALVLAACSSGGGDDHDDGDSFDGLVQELFDETSDSAAPVSVNDQHFDFSEDPHAFDDLFH